MKNCLLLLAILFTALVKGQTKDSIIDVPALASQQYYLEMTTFDGGDLTHSLNYNDPHSVDEEFSYVLEFHFSSFDSIVDRKTYDLTKDSALIKTEFGVVSAWNWGMSPKAKITGTVSVLGKSRSSIVLQEDIVVIDEYGRKLIFKSARSFSKRK